MKRVTVLFLVFIFIIGNLSTTVFADDRAVSYPKKIAVYLKPDVTVKFNNIKQVFKDSKGMIVYPIIYNGSTYLPVRAISALMKEPIEWDAASKTVFIGKTLSNPNKTYIQVIEDSSNTDIYIESVKPKLVNAYLKPDVLVMYDFVLQHFTDVNGKQVYPIIYNGTTYLPVRAISQLMKEPIEWDGATKTVSIGDGEEPIREDNNEKELVISLAAKALKSMFEREEILYYEATAKTTGLKEAISLEEKQIIAEVISENYINVQNLNAEIKALDTSDFTEHEMLAYESLASFAESTEYYILVLENIAYLAAQNADYSMLAETFLYFAMDSQTKMDEARALILKINQ